MLNERKEDVAPHIAERERRGSGTHSIINLSFNARISQIPARGGVQSANDPQKGYPFFPLLISALTTLTGALLW
jgi:hypothetical protein